MVGVIFFWLPSLLLVAMMVANIAAAIVSLNRCAALPHYKLVALVSMVVMPLLLHPWKTGRDLALLYDLAFSRTGVATLGGGLVCLGLCFARTAAARCVSAVSWGLLTATGIRFIVLLVRD